MAKKDNSTKKIHIVKDPKVKGFGMEIPNKPVKPKEPTPKSKDNKK